MNEQKLLPAGIPWYRTRLFWGIIIGILIVGNFVFFSSILQTSISLPDFVYNFLIVLGAAPIWMLLLVSVGSSAVISFGSTLLYGIILLFLFYKTFISQRVNIIYPSIIVVNLLLSASLLYIGLSAL